MPVSIMFREEHRDECLHDSSGDGGLGLVLAKSQFPLLPPPPLPPGHLGSECSGAGVARWGGWVGILGVMEDDSDKDALLVRLKAHRGCKMRHGLAAASRDQGVPSTHEAARVKGRDWARQITDRPLGSPEALRRGDCSACEAAHAKQPEAATCSRDREPACYRGHNRRDKETCAA